jgi:energy-coupling factor transporter ATP-binding protein EcfA2
LRAAASTGCWRGPQGVQAVADALLRIEGLTKRFGGVVASDNVLLDVTKGELHAIIGPNGAGKTTLISQLTGQLTPNSGTNGGEDTYIDTSDLTNHNTSQFLRLGLNGTALSRSILRFPLTAIEGNPHAYVTNAKVAVYQQDSHGCPNTADSAVRLSVSIPTNRLINPILDRVLICLVIPSF